jgi:hypothetical protein
MSQINGKVGKIELTRSEKSYGVEIDGRSYYAKKDSGIHVVPIGSLLQCETSTSEYKGKTNHWIDSFTVLGSPAASVSAPASATVAESGGTAAPQAPRAHSGSGYQEWHGIPMPFVSNIVASAIQAGQIKEPSDMVKWVTCAIDSLYEGERLIRPY